jgi:hypothetical protein
MTPAQATAMALAYSRGRFGEPPELAVSPPIWEDAERFLVILDAKASVEGDPAAMLVDTPMVWVDKSTRAVELADWMDAQDRQADMAPVSP